MKYVIYIPDSEPPGTTFNHYGVKGRSGRYKYGSGLYGYQDLRRRGLMSWSLNAEKRDPVVLYLTTFIKKAPAIGSVFTEEEIASNSQEVLCRAYLERYRETRDYRMNKVDEMKRMHKYRDELPRGSEERKAFIKKRMADLKESRKEIRRLDEIYLKQQGKTIDEETGFHLKDVNLIDENFRNPTIFAVEEKYMDGHIADMVFDSSKVNYKSIPSYPDGRKENCGICAVAYDMRRRGYDVIAKEGYNFKHDFIYKNASQYVLKDDIFKAKIKLTKDNAKSMWDDACNERKQAYDQIVKQFNTRYPKESRGIVTGSWSFLGVDGQFHSNGHIFNFERHNGRTYLIDSQTNKIFDIESREAKKYLVQYHRINAIRTDNSEIYGKDLLKNILE